MGAGVRVGTGTAADDEEEVVGEEAVVVGEADKDVVGATGVDVRAGELMSEMVVEVAPARVV